MDEITLNQNDHPRGTRFLSNAGGLCGIFERTVRKWSPSGEFVEVESPEGDVEWELRTAYKVVEILSLPEKVEKDEDIRLLMHLAEKHEVFAEMDHRELVQWKNRRDADRFREIANRIKRLENQVNQSRQYAPRAGYLPRE